jgi:ATP-dependent RNA helicase RhlE
MKFQELNLSKSILNALDEMGFVEPTPIQEKVFSVVMSGKDVCAIAQTGTGKTYGYLLPSLRQFVFSKEKIAQIMIVVPTRELVTQVVEEAKKLSKYMTVTTVGVYGGVNMKPQAAEILEGVDIVVGTPGRLMDLLNTGVLKTKNIKKVVIDEFDEMLNLGFRSQLHLIFDKLPKKRQSLLFSATLIPEVEQLLETFFNNPVRVETEASGKPLDNIDQCYYEIPNFNTKLNFLELILANDPSMRKVLVFVSTKKLADKVYERLESQYKDEVEVIHSNKAQTHRFNTVEKFEEGFCRILIATDIIARGIDVEDVSHVINFDIPEVPENYIHRIGRTGRYDKTGTAISFITQNELEDFQIIQDLMQYKVPKKETPKYLDISDDLLPDERPKLKMKIIEPKPIKKEDVGPAFHEKKDKNNKVNIRRNFEEEMKKKYGKSYRKNR